MEINPVQTDVHALSDVDYELDVRVPSHVFQARINEALKKERANLNLKGFRKGKVPLSVARKMVGPQVSMQVAERLIGEAYQDAVANKEDEYEVIGQPRMTELDFDPKDTDSDLHAIVSFAVAPDFELADLDGAPVSKFIRTFTDEDVEADLERRRNMAADLEDTEEGTALGDEHVAVANIQPIDEEGEPVGPKQEEAQIPLWNQQLREELRKALTGKAAGDTFTVELPRREGPGVEHDHGDEESGEDDHIDRYEVEIVEVKRRVLPEVTEAFIAEQSEGRAETEEELRGLIREQMEQSWERQSEQALEQKMAEEFVEAHQEIPVPEVLVEATLDGMVDEQRNDDGELPAGFDVTAFREQRREAAENQVRWMLVRDKLIREEGLELEEEDFTREFEKMAGEDTDVQMIRGYFQQQPQLIERLGEQMLQQRVIGALRDRFTIVEKSREDLEKEADERKAAEAEAADSEDEA